MPSDIWCTLGFCSRESMMLMPEAPAPGMVKGPYAVETFPVTVEGGYLYLVVDVVDVAASPPSRTELRVTS